jgi:hypothetical protein
MVPGTIDVAEREDGSIDTDKTSVNVDGEILTGETKDRRIIALNVDKPGRVGGKSQCAVLGGCKSRGGTSFDAEWAFLAVPSDVQDSEDRTTVS